LTEQPTKTTASEPEYRLQIREYLQIALRHKMWIVCISLGIAVCVGIVALHLPNVFRAETTILVDPQKVPDSYVPTTVSGSVADRLSTIRQEVMSPTQLAQLAHDLGLYPTLRGKLSEQDLIARMQKSTTIEVVDSGGQRLSAFRIAFVGTDPNQVASVTNRLASIFIERNLKARQSQFDETARFLDDELQETKRQLEEKEHQLSEIKSRYIMDLPESKQYHIEAMNSLRDQLRTSQEQVNRARQGIVYLQSMAGLDAPTVDLDRESNGATSPYQSQLQTLEAQLKELQLRYGPNFPDVRKLRDQINELKAKAAAEKPTIVSPEPSVNKSQHPVRNPVIEAELSKLDQEISDQLKSQADIQNQIQYHVSKLQQVPVFEQQIAGLGRDYDALRNHYNQLQEKKISAEMASELETHEAGERFVVLDQAVPPGRPFGPNRPLILVGGVIFGLVCGVGAAVLLEMTDETVRHEREAAVIIGKPVLAGIPAIITDQERLRGRLRAASWVAATTASSAAIGIVISRLISHI